MEIPRTSVSTHAHSIFRSKSFCIMFMRNNVLMETVEKLASDPFVFSDEDDCNIIARNREIATIYAIIIIGVCLYLYITARLEDQKDT